MRHRACAGIASSAPTSSARMARCCGYDRIAAHPRRAGDLTWLAATRPRLAVWKFASCDGCQLSLLDCEDELAGAGRRGSRSPISPRPRAPIRRGLTIFRWWKARSRRRTTPSASSKVRRAVEVSGHHRRLRDRRRHPGAAQFRRRERLHRRRLCLAAIHQDARHLDADLGARDGGLRAAWLPDQQGAARSR